MFVSRQPNPAPQQWADRFRQLQASSHSCQRLPPGSQPAVVRLLTDFNANRVSRSRHLHLVSEANLERFRLDRPGI